MKKLLEEIKTNFRQKYNMIWSISFFGIAIFLYNVAPYIYFPKPTIIEIVPESVVIGTKFNENNAFTIRGENLSDICGLYVNDKLNQDCWIMKNTDDEIIFKLPDSYLNEEQQIEIQFETHMNSDISYLSNKIKIDVMSNKTIEKPIITNVKPEKLIYDGNMSQIITLYGEGFADESMVMVDKTVYETFYNEQENSLTIQIPFGEWCTKDSVFLEVVQYYDGYASNIMSEGYYYEIAKEKQSLKKVEFSDNIIECISREEFIAHCEAGKTDFLIHLDFTEEGILYAVKESKDMDTIFPPLYNETEHLSFQELCSIMTLYPQVKVYVNFPQADTLETLNVFYNEVAELVSAKAEEEVFSRIVVKTSNEIFYYWMQIQEDNINVAYVSDVKPDRQQEEAVVDKVENEKIMKEYLERLKSERYLVFFAAQDEASYGMTDEIQENLHQLGLQESLKDKFRNSYVGIIEQGNVVYEAIDTGHLQYEGKRSDIAYKIESGNANVGSIASVQIDGVEYAINKRGLNIVVYDTLLKKVQDSVCFDTFANFELSR